MRLRIRAALPFIGLSTLLTGCEASQLYMGSKTIVGVNAAVSPDQTKGWLVIGYDRTFAAVIPRSADDPEGRKDAMSSIACSRLEVKGITIKHFKESIATGAAARTFAENLDKNDPSAVKDFFDCFKNKPTPPAQAGGANP